MRGAGRQSGGRVTDPGRRLGFSCVNVHSQQHVLVMCATAFYLIENYPLDVGPEFSASIIQVSRPGLAVLREGRWASRGSRLGGGGAPGGPERPFDQKPSPGTAVWGDAVRK